MIMPRKSSWEELVIKMAELGWSLEEFEAERSRQFYLELEAKFKAEGEPGWDEFIHDPLDEEFDDARKLNETSSSWEGGDE